MEGQAGEAEEIDLEWRRKKGQKWRDGKRAQVRRECLWEWRRLRGQPTGEDGEASEESDSEVEEVYRKVGRGWSEKEEGRRDRWEEWNKGGLWELGAARIKAVLWPWTADARGLQNMLAAGAYTVACWEAAGWDIDNEEDHRRRRRGGMTTKKGLEVDMGEMAEGRSRMVGTLTKDGLTYYGMAAVGWH